MFGKLVHKLDYRPKERWVILSSVCPICNNFGNLKGRKVNGYVNNNKSVSLIWPNVIPMVRVDAYFVKDLSNPSTSAKDVGTSRAYMEDFMDRLDGYDLPLKNTTVRFEVVDEPPVNKWIEYNFTLKRLK